METLFNITVFVVLAAGAYLLFKIIKFFIHHEADHMRSLNLVFLKIAVPKKDSKQDMEDEQASMSAQKDFKEICGIGAHLFEALHSIYTHDVKHYLIGQDFFSLEYAVIDNQIYFYIVVPRELRNLI